MQKETNKGNGYISGTKYLFFFLSFVLPFNRVEKNIKWNDRGAFFVHMQISIIYLRVCVCVCE